ncbi:hypothetical protein GA0070215_11213 [Micromonospora marina]|uniref:Lipoprotein n=1 Tax=Micromonospora marina TaxID=307120 RepID=A0A1C4YN90_9ACTN|nr:hypothetical protein GA0070215_11213 [Micromonospora marina]
MMARTAASLLLAATALILTSGCAPEPATPPRSATTPVGAPLPVVRTLRTPDTLLGLTKNMDRVAIESAKRHLDTLKREVAPATSAAGWAYGGHGPDADMVFVTGVSGTVIDQQGLVERALNPYRVGAREQVDAGPLGGTARCGQGRTEMESYLVVCAWADTQTLGIVAFLSSRPIGDRTAQFLEVREAMTETAG